MIQRIKDAIQRHEEEKIQLNRQDLLDLTDMTLADTLREHNAVTIRLHRQLYDPEGLELLQERESGLLRKIKLMRRMK